MKPVTVLKRMCAVDINNNLDFDIDFDFDLKFEEVRVEEQT